MNHLFNLLIIGLLLLNLVGIGLAARKLSGLPYGMAKTSAVVLGCMVFFCLEHFVSIGSLAWLLPVSTVGAGWVIWKERDTLFACRWAEAVFLLGFFYTLLWRYPNPDIAASVEKLADLNFIASYMQGGRLPVPDLWLDPYKLTGYYSFQHYGAALLGRIMNLEPGTAYNIGYCVLVGLVLPPAMDFVRVFTTKRFPQILILAALLFGGTGACIVTPFLMANEVPHHSMRFIGGSDAEPDAALKPMGIALRQLVYGTGKLNPETGLYELDRTKILELPMEIFSYLVILGDYHAPLSGYLTLTIALGAFGVLLQNPPKREEGCAWGIFLGTLPLTIASNTWSFPLQALLVLGGIAFFWRYRKQPDWSILIGVSVISWMLFYPFFAYFLTKTVGGGMSVKLVRPEQHAPVISYLIVMWPTILLSVLGWFAVPEKQKEYRWFVVFLFGLLVMIECLNIDDIYSGNSDRFNTALKWSPWVASLAVLLLAPINLESSKSWVRVGTLVPLFATLVFLGVLAKDWKNHFNRGAFGKLDGTHWYRSRELDPTVPASTGLAGSILNYLEAHPGGVVLERPPDPINNEPFAPMAFIETGAIPLFTGHPAVFGWASHEQLWRGYQRDIDQRWNRAREFFRGELVEPLEYLDSLNVRFIIWPALERVDPGLFDTIKSQISSKFHFVRLDEAEPNRGIWVRKDSAE